MWWLCWDLGEFVGECLWREFGCWGWGWGECEDLVVVKVFRFRKWMVELFVVGFI